MSIKDMSTYCMPNK